jgi:hypothetical protein
MQIAHASLSEREAEITGRLTEIEEMSLEAV